MINFLQKSAGFILIFAIISCLGFNNLFSENLLKTVAIQYKVQSRNLEHPTVYSNLIPYSKVINYQVIAGEERSSIQPTAIIQNVSDKELTFNVFFKIYNNTSNRFIYSNKVPVSAECLTVGANKPGGCTFSEEVRVRYCNVSENHGDFEVNYLPFPGNEGLTGIPPNGFAEIEFNTFIPSDMVTFIHGNCTAFLFIEPVIPETGDTLKETDFSDDTLKVDLTVRKALCAELFYPEEADTINYRNNWLYALGSGMLNADYYLEVSKSVAFDPINVTINSQKQKNVVLDANVRYFWRLKAIDGDSTCVSETRSFYTSGLTGVFEDKPLINISPNPASDYIEISINNNGASPIASGKVQIFNMLGIEVMSVGTGLDQSSQRIDVSHLPSGVYYIRIGNRVEKFVKM
ncbi:MAG: T9SS type A sorting domain-containing protein [Candidatus Kapabacteria bacterium]|nr:T9SS type A sorting domain-containing protein [Candidatus Kapabacteria bacterium]